MNSFFALLKNIFFILVTPVAWMLRKKAGVPRHILVVQGSKLGDMVCTTPLFRAVKERYPHSHLTVMGNAVNKELLAGHPRIDMYRIRPPGFFALLKFLREEKFDFVCMTSPDPEMLTAFLCARIPLVAVPYITNGWSSYNTRVYRILSRFATVVPHRMGSYAPREYLRLLEPLGIMSEDTRKELAVSPKIVERIRRMLIERGCDLKKEYLIGIAPSAGNKIKVWGAEHFAYLADVLTRKHAATIVLVGSPGDKEEVDAMKRALPPRMRLVDTAGKLSIEELKALVGCLRLFISSDTGPIYIAEAFGIPTVDIIGPMDENEQPPRGPKHRVVVPPGRKVPALHIMNAAMIDRVEARRQAQSTTRESVVREIEDLLQHLGR